MKCHICQSWPWICVTVLAALPAACSFGGGDGVRGVEPAVTENRSEPAPNLGNSGADSIANLAPRLVFAPCTEDPELECGQLSVPLDYEDPHRQRISIAVVRAPAFSARKRGSIVVNPGGPGGSGVDFLILAKSLFSPLRADFDIVSFDPRGVARSGEVACTFEQPPPPTDSTLEARAAFLDEFGRRYASACREQHGALTTQVGTNNAARDMDVLRASLGERELNYLGFSYGTILGASYATLFPKQVRAMVLDANLAPGWLGDYLVEIDGDGSAGSEQVLQRIEQLCRAADDCPLKTAGVVTVFDRVVDRLNRNPVIINSNAVITGRSVIDAVFPALGSDVRGWPFIVSLLARVDAGDLAGLPAFPLTATSTMTLPSTFAITCDDTTTKRLGLDYLPAQTGTQAVDPRFGGLRFGIAVTLCSQWPQTRVVPVDNIATRNSIVLIGNDFDPATPLAWSRNMGVALGAKSTLVRYRGGGHTIFGSGSACIDGAVVGYFRDPAAPPVGLTCPAQVVSFGSTQLATSATMAEVLARVTPKAPALSGWR
jgi:pimeloyl-ACP methyl ester carboxylesterase